MSNKQSGIIDFSTSEQMECPNWVSFPSDTKGAVGGLLGTNPVVCGGVQRHPGIDSVDHLLMQEVWE